MRVGPPCWGQCPEKTRKGHPSSLPPRRTPTRTESAGFPSPEQWETNVCCLSPPASNGQPERPPTCTERGALGAGRTRSAERLQQMARGTATSRPQSREKKPYCLGWKHQEEGGQTNPDDVTLGTKHGQGLGQKKKKVFTCHLPRYAWSPRICHWGWPSGSSCTTSPRDASGHSC